MKISIETIIRDMRNYIPDLNEGKIREAYELARSSHEGQFRKSGEEYIIHPLHVASILIPMQMGKTEPQEIKLTEDQDNEAFLDDFEVEDDMEL